MEKIYAKTLNPESFDYQLYDWILKDDDKFIIDGGRDLTSINEEVLKPILNLYNDYYSWDFERWVRDYYDNSIKKYFVDLLPKKTNGKKYSNKEIHDIKVALDSDDREKIIIACLSIIKCTPYKVFGLRGYCQGDYVTLYAPACTEQNTIDYIEAIYFGTGTEIEINEECDDVKDANDICGYTFYTSSWSIEMIKQEIREQVGASDDAEVVLYQFDGYYHTPKYKLAE